MNEYSNISLIQIIEDEPRISHRIISEETKNQEKTISKLIRNYMNKLELFGRVGFKIQTLKTAGGNQEVKTFYLNEQQATLLLTFMRNNEIVINFKVRLVKEFYKMRESLKSQDVDLSKLKKRAELIHVASNLAVDYEQAYLKVGITRQEELGITVNRAVAKDSTVDFLEIAEKKGLSTTEKYFTVTELCEIVRNGDFSEEAKKVVSTKNGEKPRPQNLNKLLEKEGFQFRENEIWKATEKGQEFSDFVQNKSKHSEKTVFHTVWKKEILNKLFSKK
jgi:phage regulator Rha-like protein